MNATLSKAAAGALAIATSLIAGCGGSDDDVAARGNRHGRQRPRGDQRELCEPLQPEDGRHDDQLRRAGHAALHAARRGRRDHGPFCRVIGVSNPTADSTINFEVWLPPSGTWNSKFYSSTGGGSTGAIQYGAMATGLAANFAAMSQDRGHVSRGDLGVPASTDGSWAAGHPEKIIDWAHRAQHVTTVASKAIVNAFYASAPQRSYFVGCSAGGHVGTMEAQRYPDDYDGIVAGAPAWNWSNLMAGRLWASEPSLKNLADALPAAKLTVLNNAAVAACDAIDGVTDALIDDPRKCNYDPGPLQCAGADAPTCLTAAQVGTARHIYAGPKRANGQQVFPGYPRGSERLWTVNTGSAPGGSSFDFFRYWVYENQSYDSRTFNFDSDVDFANNKLVSGQTMASVVNATPDLRAFGARGSKLLIWHGWGDEQVHSLSSIDYHDRVVAANTKAETDKFMRVFMLPGVMHCGGGAGPDTIDTLTPLMRWVEQGIAPDRIIASKVDRRHRDPHSPALPLSPGGEVQRRGSIDVAESFTCATP